MEDSKLLNGLACAAISLSLNLLFQNNQSVDPEIKSILQILPNLLVRICSTNQVSGENRNPPLIRFNSSEIESNDDSSQYFADDETPKTLFIDSKTGIQYREVDPVSVHGENSKSGALPKRSNYFNDSLVKNNKYFESFAPRFSPRTVSTPRNSSEYYRFEKPIYLDNRSQLRRFIPETSFKAHFNDFSHKQQNETIKSHHKPIYIDIRPQLRKLKRQLNFDVQTNNSTIKSRTAEVSRKRDNENDESENLE